MMRPIVIMLFLGVLAMAGCRTAPIYNPTDVAFAPAPSGMHKQLTMEDYRNAIIRAGTNRGWTFEDAGPGHLIGHVAVRGKHFATVDVLYSKDDFSIKYKDSRNLDYNPSTGQIHENYNSWVTNLRNDIQAEVTRMKAS